jgi:integrase/recombinase XerD
MMLYCGLRSAEVLGLDVTDVDIGGRWVQVTGKGNRERRVPLDPGRSARRPSSRERPDRAE